jgi:PIN domain nuclease of toxin-antitoxin system
MPPEGDRIPAANDLAGPLHDDPADRVIIATALALGMPLITRDRRLQDYPHLETIW